ncbi:DNA repair protein RadA [uncultured Pseudokineococcus sp.]|uniref:DNA repair protein RadA n=1 Tax=uncultured Pseudokineococcus sp. TaxID=1642928 RepID=UPI00262DB77D|nr:DNA repair protein RadA [uncultured Pseudokineococcus sp.]
MVSKSAAPRPPRPAYRCADCGWATGKWVGRCAECHAWGTVEEVAAPSGPRTAPARAVRRAAQPIAEVDAQEASAAPTGVDELDRVLGGGIVPGAVVLLAGEPGVGKSTLLLEVAARTATTGKTVLYVTGEETAAQVRLRAERIGALRPRLYLAAENDLAAVLAHVEAVSPDLLVLDSVQTVASAAVEGSAGGVTQVREVAAAVIATAKERGMAALLVGHVTKDGSVAGPRVLEHLVDVVCTFEGDRHSRLRMVRAVKNRYGPTDEVGCFDLSEGGITGLVDPSELFLSRTTTPVPGTCATVALEGRRPLVVEVQALVAPAAGNAPKTRSTGLDASRVALAVAVLQARAGLLRTPSDVFTATVGGVRTTEPGVDLALAVAIASACFDTPLPPGTVAIGELGLSGDVRAVPGTERRLVEAARLGMQRALVPRGALGVHSPSPAGGGRTDRSLRAGSSPSAGPDGDGPVGPPPWGAMQVLEVDDVRSCVLRLFAASDGAPGGGHRSSPGER